MKLSTFIKIGFGISIGYSLGQLTTAVASKLILTGVDAGLVRLENKLQNQINELENELEEKE